MEKAFAVRLMGAVNEIPTLKKDVQGYGYKYTNLDTIFSVIKPILSKHELGFYQAIDFQEGVTGVRTTLFDIDGNSIESFTALPETSVKGANGAQNMGASITYIKRYAISALLGISSDEDTDGLTNEDIIKKAQQGASQGTQQGTQQNTQPSNKNYKQNKKPASKSSAPVSSTVDVPANKKTPLEKLDFIEKKYKLAQRPEIKQAIDEARVGSDNEVLTTLYRCEEFLKNCGIKQEEIYD